MSNEIQVEKINEVSLRVYSDFSIEEELSEHFRFRVEGYQFMPAYRNRLFDGYIRLYNKHTKILPAGLYHQLEAFAKQNSYSLDFVPNNYYDYPFLQDSVSMETLQEFIDSLNITSKGKPLTVRDYQLEAILHAINSYRSVLISPTGSGKSLIIYVLIRWLMATYSSENKEHFSCVLIFPRTSLVEQLYTDFEDYSSCDSKWDVNDNLQKLYSGFSKNLAKPVLLSTWQTLVKLPRQFLNQFDAVFGDEAHLFQAKSLTSIMEKMHDVKYRIGTTGTIDNKLVHKLQLEGMFGPILKVATTKELMEKKQLAALKINGILLQYDDQISKAVSKFDYDQELKFLISHEKRNKFIRNLAVSLKGNTLVLFNYIDHGKLLFDLIQQKKENVHLVYGGVETDERETIRKIVEHQDDAVIVASYGTFSTGINIPSLENIIFSHPSKSKIRNLQSIGRGLRITDSKTQCTLYDIADDLHWKNKKNITLSHFIERIKIYSEENFSFRILEVKL